MHEGRRQGAQARSNAAPSARGKGLKEARPAAGAQARSTRVELRQIRDVGEYTCGSVRSRPSKGISDTCEYTCGSVRSRPTRLQLSSASSNPSLTPLAAHQVGGEDVVHDDEADVAAVLRLPAVQPVEAREVRPLQQRRDDSATSRRRAAEE